ncbi:hypothetical protein ACKAV7_013946 [Fusarium commune]
MSSSNSRNAWCAICGVTIESHIIKLRLLYPKGFSTYDPDVVCDADVEWLDQVHLLGYNPSATTRSKFYISGLAIIGRGVDLASETRTDPAFAGVDDDIVAYISSPEFEKPRQYRHEVKRESNPLTALPETVIFGVSEFLDNHSLINLFCASLETFSSLRDNGSFWKRRIITHLPYFFELHEYLKEQSQSLENKDVRKIFLWADAESKRQSGVTRFMFPVANRRRIWKVCEQIGEIYNQEPQQKDVPKSYLGRQARRNKGQVVGDTREPGLYFRSAYFLRDWTELLRPWTLDLFWNSEGDLSGIAVTFGQDQRIFGHEPQESGVCQTTGSFPGGVWVKGFVFHIYASSVLRPWQACSWNYSSCKGVTVHLTDGSGHTYGQDGRHLLKIPFAATEKMTIVGMKGTLTAHRKRDVETRYLRDMDDDGSIWPEKRWDTFNIDGPGGERIEEVIVHHALFRDPSPKAIEICTNRGRSVIWGVDMERGEGGEETNEPCPRIMSHRLPTHLRPDDGFAIIGFVMGCGKVFGRWHSDEYHVERSKVPGYHSRSRRLNYWGEDYIDEEDSRGPWTKDQYDRRNESTIHTGMSKFGIITKKIADGLEQGI